MKPGDHPEFFRFPAPEGRSRESTIRLDAARALLARRARVEHAGLAAALHSWISRHPDDGRYILTNGYDWTYFTVDDAPYFVRSLRIEPDRGRPRAQRRHRGGVGPGDDARREPMRRSTRPSSASARGRPVRGQVHAPRAGVAGAACSSRATVPSPSVSIGGRVVAHRTRGSHGSQDVRASGSIRPPRMRLLIADKLHPRAIEELRTLPLEVVYEPELTRRASRRGSPASGILVVRSTEVTAAAIEQRQAAEPHRARGRRVRHHRRARREPARHLRRQLPGQERLGGRRARASGSSSRSTGASPTRSRRCAPGKWERQEYGKAEGLHGKTLGVAGLGAIGREVAQRARAFGLNVVGVEPVAHAGARGGARDRLRRVARGARGASSHILTLHLALDERTRHIVEPAGLDLLPDRAMLINTARADLVDHDALLEAVEKRGLRVGLDVFPDEPRGSQDVPGAGALPLAPRRAGSSTGRRTSPRRPIRRSSPSRPRRCGSSARSCSRRRCPTWSTCRRRRRRASSSSSG